MKKEREEMASIRKDMNRKKNAHRDEGYRGRDRNDGYGDREYNDKYDRPSGRRGDYRDHRDGSREYGGKSKRSSDREDRNMEIDSYDSRRHEKTPPQKSSSNDRVVDKDSYFYANNDRSHHRDEGKNQPEEMKPKESRGGNKDYPEARR